MITLKFKLFGNISKFLNSLLASRVILEDLVINNNTYVKLSKVNFKDPSVHKCPGYFDVGVAAKFQIRDLVKKRKVNQTQRL